MSWSCQRAGAAAPPRVRGPRRSRATTTTPHRAGHRPTPRLRLRRHHRRRPTGVPRPRPRRKPSSPSTSPTPSHRRRPPGRPATHLPPRIDQPVRSIKAYEPRTTTHVSWINPPATAGTETPSNTWGWTGRALRGRKSTMQDPATGPDNRSARDRIQRVLDQGPRPQVTSAGLTSTRPPPRHLRRRPRHPHRPRHSRRSGPDAFAHASHPRRAGREKPSPSRPWPPTPDRLVL